MREIKFRCWFYDGDDLASGEMLSGGMALREDYIDFDGERLKPTDKCTVLMQSTGLLDAYGVSIYEGDIVRLPLFSGTLTSAVTHSDKLQIPVVHFDGLDEVEKPLHIYAGRGRADSCLEIIGNIYQNPYLLEAE